MNKAEYKNMFDNEETHFFYVANHKIFLHLLSKRIPRDKNLKILDAGCGTGLFAHYLQEFGNVKGVDYHEDAVRLSKKRGVSAVRSDIRHIPFKDNTFDVVTCIDVIVHQKIKSDVAIVRELRRVLKPGGILLLRVAAVPWLMSQHDRYVMTRERYSKNHLKNTIEKAGLTIEKLSYMNFLLFFPAALNKLFERASGKHESSIIANTPKWINNAAMNTLASERFILDAINLPIGNGLVVIAKK